MSGNSPAIQLDAGTHEQFHGVLRYAVGSAIIMMFALGYDYQLAYFNPVLARNFLAPTAKAPTLKSSVAFLLSVALASLAGLMFSRFFLDYPLVFLPLLALILFHIYYTTALQSMKVWLIISLLLIPMLSMQSAQLGGIIAGAFTFFFLDLLIDRLGAKGRKDMNCTHQSNIAVPIVLATIMDGIPETLVVGMSLLAGGEVGIGMLVAVFISNLPEAIAGTSGMVAGAWKSSKIQLLWLLVAVVCALASMAGYGLLENATAFTISVIQTFAAGAILVMLCNTMIPEAYEHGGKLAGIVTVAGFAVAVTVAVLEAMG